MAHDLHCTSTRRIVRLHAEQGLFSNLQAPGQEQQNASFRKQVASYLPPPIKTMGYPSMLPVVFGQLGKVRFSE
ncbi:hypothetical protein B5F76_06055 [Desulfovibrio sp. An276]|uniref:hypothetical protein n=1 Tax=Desulfovibrio sp. An276 TaxID=1965618 RepID=UPI000B3A5D4E|nr:hypothetical protein [Desulfovibrio sp. An276]OUO53112.1 hypothetical protein B5F76_06055 [Desulfovibrio sp. An276]